MQAVILAAGRGVRMGRLTDSTPKPMLTLKDKPILDYKIRYLPDEVDEVVLIVSHRADAIRRYFGGSFGGRRIVYVEQAVLNGSGGALHAAREKLNGRFLVLMGDDLYLKNDLNTLLHHHRALLAYILDKPTVTAALKIGDDGTFEGVLEKQNMSKGELINTGAYVLDSNFFDYGLVPVTSTEYGLPQTMATMSARNPIVIETASRWLSVTSPDDLTAAEKELLAFYPEG